MTVADSVFRTSSAWTGLIGTVIALFVSVIAVASGALELTRTGRLRTQIAKEQGIVKDMAEGMVRTHLEQLVERRSALLALRIEARQRPWMERVHPSLLLVAGIAWIASQVVAHITSKQIEHSNNTVMEFRNQASLDAYTGLLW